MNYTKFCTFWYPTIYHQDLACIPGSKNTTKSIEISDTKWVSHSKEKNVVKHKINITLDDDENLKVESVIGGKPAFELKLTRTEKKRNGFVQYSFDASEITDYDYFEKILRKDIYHLAKEFYHEHEADTGKDSALRAIVTNEPEEIDAPDNKFLIDLLENYTPVFLSYVRDLSVYNKKIQEFEQGIQELEETDIRNKEELLTYFKKSLFEYCLKINCLCENALIEYTFCKTLLGSGYNKSFYHVLQNDEDIKNEDKNKLRRQALNIRNSIRYIEYTKYKNQNRLNAASRLMLDKIDATSAKINRVLENSKAVEKRNTILSILSIFLAVLFGISSMFTDATPGLIKAVWGTVLLTGLIAFAVYLYKSTPKKPKPSVAG